jgi:hypothetical protein
MHPLSLAKFNVSERLIPCTRSERTNHQFLCLGLGVTGC